MPRARYREEWMSSRSKRHSDIRQARQLVTPSIAQHWVDELRREAEVERLKPRNLFI